MKAETTKIPDVTRIPNNPNAGSLIYAMQHLGYDRASVANLQERQVGQEKVHGCVQGWTGKDGKGYECIACQ